MKIRRNDAEMHASLRIISAIAALGTVAGCSSIENQRGYLVDQVLVASVQPGIDNRQSVEGTLGRPTLTSQYGDPIWYYISSRTEQAPFTTPKIARHQVLAIKFDEAGNVLSAESTGVEQVVRIDPDSEATPTLGIERGLLEDLFGNIGTVGAPMGGSGGPG